MNTRSFVFILAVLAVCISAQAHRLDEYLQATTINVQANRIEIRLHLTPGVAVFDKAFAAMDTDHDGALSPAEQTAYAQHVIGDLHVAIDGKAAPLRLASSKFATVDDMKEGFGEIELNLEALLPAAGSNRRTFAIENHHQNSISVYLVNCLVPSDSTIHILAQNRNYDQSSYQLEFEQAASGFVAANASGDSSLVKAYIYQGVHHILTGYDHLLFVSALVLAATTLWDVVKVVFVFTLAHSITLTLAALKFIHLPEHIVEPMIAGSIVFIAAQNVFWPTRARGWTRLAAAFFFGLFHGLGFAGGLLEAMQRMPSSTMLLAIGAFSIGVELGHQMVVLPLFGILKSARQLKPDVVARTQLSMAMQRIGSAGISVAGMYYLCLALTGNS